MMEVEATGLKEGWKRAKKAKKKAKKLLKDGQKTALRQSKIIWKLDQSMCWLKESRKLYYS